MEAAERRLRVDTVDLADEGAVEIMGSATAMPFTGAVSCDALEARRLRADLVDLADAGAAGAAK